MLLSLEELKLKLEDRNIAVIAKKTGVSYQTIYKLSKGETTRMFSDNHWALDKYFRKEMESSHERLAGVNHHVD